MEILHPDIVKFIEEMRVLKAVGCLRVPKASHAKLMELLRKADAITAPVAREGVVAYRDVHPGDDLHAIAGPFIIIVTEEEFSADQTFADAVRDVTAYSLACG
ncbi:MAG: hypothetical protein V2A66_00830 [Pseudomonadota bacterium]